MEKFRIVEESRFLTNKEMANVKIYMENSQKLLTLAIS